MAFTGKTRLYDQILTVILMITGLCLLTTCSNAKFAGNGSSEQGGEDDKTTEQPTDIAVTLPTAPNECGGPNNSCYAPHNLKDRKYGDVKTITGTTEKISYVTVGERPYWRSLTRGTDRFLNFSGFWDPAKKLGWQMYLTPDGRTFNDSKYLVDADLYRIHGRACPGRVFTGGDDAGETGRCIYYKSLNLSNLKAGGVPKRWTDKKWFSTNHSACAALGMRLPTLYELDAFKDASQDVDLPPNPSTIRAVGGTGIVYAGGYTTYSILTATTGTKGASECGGDDCYAGVVNGMVSTSFNPDSSISDGTLYCVLH
jgi:hypothetical protein